MLRPLQVFTARRAKTRLALRRATLLGGLVAVAVPALAASALAVSGTPIKIAQPQSYDGPSVAVDSTGTAYIAWDNTKNLGGIGEVVEYCVLPTGAAACTYTGQLHLAAGPGSILGHVQVLIDGGTVLVFAGEVFVKGEQFEPEQVWQSTDGGRTFTPLLSGKSVARPAEDERALVLPGTGDLGLGGTNLGFETDGVENVGQAGFEVFPLSPGEECSRKHCPPSEESIPLQAKLARELEKYGQGADSYASVTSGPAAGVLGAYTVSSSQNECGGEGIYNQLAFVFGEGPQEANNSYAIPPGKPHSAWKTELTHSESDCNVNGISAAGGPSGFGVVENEEARNYLIYHAFDQKNRDFDTPTTVISTETGSEPVLSQDGSGNLYVTFRDGNGAEALAFSSNGGASWTGPAPVTAATYKYGNATSEVSSAGQGWLVWDNEESVYAQQFVASDAVPPVTTPISTPIATPVIPPTPDSNYAIESIVSNSNGTVTITFVPTQSGEATLVVTVPTASIASASATTAKSKKCKHGQIKIKGKCLPSTTAAGRTSASGTAGVPLKLTVSLSSKIKSLLKKGKTVHLTATLTYTSALGGTPTTHTYSLTVKGHKPKHKK